MLCVAAGTNQLGAIARMPHLPDHPSPWTLPLPTYSYSTPDELDRIPVLFCMTHALVRSPFKTSVSFVSTNLCRKDRGQRWQIRIFSPGTRRWNPGFSSGGLREYAGAMTMALQCRGRGFGPEFPLALTQSMRPLSLAGKRYEQYRSYSALSRTVRRYLMRVPEHLAPSTFDDEMMMVER